MNRRAIGVLGLALAALSLAAAPLPTVYEAAVLGTIVPAALLRAVAIVESAERDHAVGDDGISVGRYQLNELYHAERAGRWGEYDPRDPLAAGYVAARILQDNLRLLGTWELAIAAYRQGIRGVEDSGPTAWYVERVWRAWR